jgi:REP element-mobilizing transposase RayT
VLDHILLSFAVMSHTLNYQFVHLLWPTKDLFPLIVEDSKSSLLSYLAGIMKRLGGLPLASSGTSNHVHLLAKIPTNLSISELLRQLKACSSKWYRHKNNQHFEFGWSEGYSAFTISPASIDKVKKYLACEQERHKKRAFQDELVSFLKLQEIEFNSQFLINTTYTRLIYHLVWSVKKREPLLDISFQVPLHQSIKQEIRRSGAKLYEIGSVVDHIHLLVEVTSTISVSNLMQNLKTTTTHLIKSKNEKLANFCWQEGYGVFSVGKPALEVVSNYVRNQEAHHSQKTFEQELNWLAEV